MDGTVAVSGTVAVTDNGGALTVDSTQLPAALAANGGLKIEGVASGVAVPVSGTFWQATQPVSLAAAVAVTDNGGTLSVDDGAGSLTVDGTVTVQDGGGSLTVDGSVTANPTRPATPTVTSVNDTATSTTLLASNASRLGATVYNDSTVNLFVKLGATASATSFTVRLEPNTYYEVPFGYTGIIDGIWASDASGAARITELAA